MKNNIAYNLKTLVQSKGNKKILYGVGVLFAALAIFQAGVFVGYKKANFSYGLGDNYHRMFGEHGSGGFWGEGGKGMMRSGDFSNAHGAAGKVLKINLPEIMIAGQDGVEKSVVVGQKTIIRQFRNEVSATSIKIGDTIIAIGAPNTKAQIEATFIRITPSFIDATTSVATTTR